MVRVPPPPPPYFEGARFISEVFSSWFDDMFEKIWILLKFWPFSAAARLVTGAKIAISASPAPLFVGFWWARHPPPPILRVGNPFFKVLGCGLMV